MEKNVRLFLNSPAHFQKLKHTGFVNFHFWKLKNSALFKHPKPIFKSQRKQAL